jgi:hypothetical protein
MSFLNQSPSQKNPYRVLETLGRNKTPTTSRKLLCKRGRESISPEIDSSKKKDSKFSPEAAKTLSCISDKIGSSNSVIMSNLDGSGVV